MSIRLRVRLPGGQSTVSAASFGELAAHISAEVGEGANWALLCGYPPEPIDPLPAAEEPLTSFLRSGDTVIVQLKASEMVVAPTSVQAVSTIMQPQSARLPSAVAVDEDEEMRLAMAMSLGHTAPKVPAATGAVDPGGERLIRRVIPADNSCLFAAVAHATQGSAGRRERADSLRRIVADAVLADGSEYDEAMLGRPRPEYAAWILKGETWGGGIELAILAAHFGIEIAAFDIQTRRVDLFGQGAAAPSRILLLYDGVHYDLIVKQLFEGASEDLDVRHPPITAPTATRHCVDEHCAHERRAYRGACL